MSAQDDDERNASPFPKPLNSAQIADAQKRSSDAGATIILSKLRISDIGAMEAEELANSGKYFRQESESGSIVERYCELNCFMTRKNLILCLGLLFQIIAFISCPRNLPFSLNCDI